VRSSPVPVTSSRSKTICTGSVSVRRIAFLTAVV
jgi:hypothetical protein